MSIQPQVVMQISSVLHCLAVDHTFPLSSPFHFSLLYHQLIIPLPGARTASSPVDREEQALPNSRTSHQKLSLSSVHQQFPLLPRSFPPMSSHVSHCQLHTSSSLLSQHNKGVVRTHCLYFRSSHAFSSPLQPGVVPTNSPPSKTTIPSGEQVEKSAALA